MGGGKVLGVLKEIEGMVKCPLYQCFDLIFGTSTGSIIASLIALGYEIDEIHDLCEDAGVAFFFKQWGGRNKKASGRTFRGRTFEEMPIYMS